MSDGGKDRGKRNNARVAGEVGKRGREGVERTGKCSGKGEMSERMRERERELVFETAANG